MRLKVTREMFPDRKQFNLVQRKGVYAYGLTDMSSLDKNSTAKIPKRKQFFDRLLHKECSKADYKHAKRVWKVFGCQNYRDFHDIYLKSDVTFLADFFEHFRSMCMDFYSLDPVHYYSAAGLSWDSCLKMTGVEL